MAFALVLTLNDKAYLYELNKTHKNLTNFNKPLIKAGNLLKQETDKQFPSKGSNLLDKEWEPRKKNYSHPILQKTGKLRRSFKYTPTNPKDRLTFFSTLENDYYKYHQLGTVKMPQRQMIVLNNKLQSTIVSYFTDHLQKYLVNYKR